MFSNLHRIIPPPILELTPKSQLPISPLSHFHFVAYPSPPTPHPPLHTHTHTCTIAFCHFFSHCKRLQTVCLKCCMLVDNKAVSCLVQNCPMLTSLSVSGCVMVTDKSLVAIGLRCKNLLSLDVTKTKVATQFSSTILPCAYSAILHMY